MLSRHTRMVVQKSNLGHPNKIVILKMLKLLRSYLVCEGQERVNIQYIQSSSEYNAIHLGKNKVVH